MIFYIHLYVNGKNIDHTKCKDIEELEIGSIWKPFGHPTHPPRYKILNKIFVSKVFEEHELWKVEVEELESEYDVWNGPYKPTKYDKQIGLINKILNGSN